MWRINIHNNQTERLMEYEPFPGGIIKTADPYTVIQIDFSTNRVAYMDLRTLRLDIYRYYSIGSLSTIESTVIGLDNKVYFPQLGGGGVRRFRFNVKSCQFEFFGPADLTGTQTQWVGHDGKGNIIYTPRQTTYFTVYNPLNDSVYNFGNTGSTNYVYGTPLYNPFIDAIVLPPDNASAGSVGYRRLS